MLSCDGGQPLHLGVLRSNISTTHGSYDLDKGTGESTRTWRHLKGSAPVVHPVHRPPSPRRSRSPARGTRTLSTHTRASPRLVHLSLYLVEGLPCVDHRHFTQHLLSPASASCPALHGRPGAGGALPRWHRAARRRRPAGCQHGCQSQIQAADVEVLAGVLVVCLAAACGSRVSAACVSIGALLPWAVSLALKARQASMQGRCREGAT